MYCVMFSRPISDEVRDTLLVNAYLMLKSYSKTKRIKASCCDGQIKTDFKEVAFCGMSGILFEGRVETDQGDLKVTYLVRHQDVQTMEETERGAWLAKDELDDIPQSKVRPNPIHALSKKHLEN